MSILNNQPTTLTCRGGDASTTEPLASRLFSFGRVGYLWRFHSQSFSFVVGCKVSFDIFLMEANVNMFRQLLRNPFFSLISQVRYSGTFVVAYCTVRWRVVSNLEFLGGGHCERSRSVVSILAMFLGAGVWQEVGRSEFELAMLVRALIMEPLEAWCHCTTLFHLKGQ